MNNQNYIKDEKLIPGKYKFIISDPFLKYLKKGITFEIKEPLKYTEIVLNDYVFCIKIKGEKTCFTADMIEKIT